MRLLALILGLATLVDVASGQIVLRDSTESVELPTLVVTATRSARNLERVPVPTTVIAGETIRQRGAVRMTDVLADEVGLMLVEDHGTGLQLQGFDPAYTLILIDGEQVIGRTAGTLDLDRLGVADVERVEIVRGPTSALYGSEALAGVVNIITRRPTGPAVASVRTHFETHGTTGINANAEMRRGSVGARFTVDRLSSEGYDLTPGTIGVTVPPMTQYLLSGVLESDLSDRAEVQLTGRLSTQLQENEALMTTGADEVRAKVEGMRTDWSVAPQLRYRVRNGLVMNARLYSTHYRTREEISAMDAGDAFSRSTFRQQYQKAEIQADWLAASRHLVTMGAGVIRESVAADRIQGERREISGGFGLIQHEFAPVSELEIITSGRLDLHSSYGSHLSPKIALLARPHERLRFRASLGSGFKSPTFQQLYLDFANPTAGYSVVGSIDAEQMLQVLEGQGQIVRYLTDPSSLNEVGPETAVSVNVGFESEPASGVTVRLNVFHNEVSDLIETAPVAVKPNGQSVFTYFNLNRIYTRGIEAELRLRPVRAIGLSAGYQLLDAGDRDVLDAIDERSLFTRVNGRDRPLTRREYGGLMNRSRHGLNLQFSADHGGLTAIVRGQYRSRYGYGDVNGNLVLDDEREYVSGYWLWHVTLSHALPMNLTAQVGARNLFGHSDPAFIPSLSGRLFFAGVQLNL